MSTDSGGDATSNADTRCGEACTHDDPPGTPGGGCCALTCVLPKGHCPTDHQCAKGHRWSCSQPIA
jgi:hypothetical protein